MAAVWRLWWTASLCSVEHNWRWTPLWYRRCTVMGRHTEGLLMWTGLFWSLQGGGKECTYPELVRPGRSARLVVLAGDVAGRSSEETVSFIRHLAKARVRGEPTILKKRAEQAWRMRWCCLLACAAARAFAASLLERRGPGGADGETPSVHHVVNDWRFASLDLAA